MDGTDELRRSEALRALRMAQDRNQMALRERKRNIYMTEENREEPIREMKKMGTTNTIKLRFLFSFMLFMLFYLMDQQEYTKLTNVTNLIRQEIGVEGLESVLNLFDFVEDIPYTLSVKDIP